MNVLIIIILFQDQRNLVLDALSELEESKKIQAEVIFEDEDEKWSQAELRWSPCALDSWVLRWVTWLNSLDFFLNTKWRVLSQNDHESYKFWVKRDNCFTISQDLLQKCRWLLKKSRHFNTQYWSSSSIVYLVAIDCVSKINMFGLKIIVKSGLHFFLHLLTWENLFWHTDTLHTRKDFCPKFKIQQQKSRYGEISNNNNSRPLFTIIFRTKLVISGTDSILTRYTMYE